MARVADTKERPAVSNPPATESNHLEPEKKQKRSPVIFIVVGVIALIGVIFGVKTWSFNSVHATTDDAYITTDVVPITPKIQGSVVDIPAKENRHVNKGDLLVQLDDSTYRADLDQAEANLAVAKAGAQGANATVGLTQATGAAQIAEAQGGVAQSSSDIGSATAGIEQARAATLTAEAGVGNARAQQISAQSTVQSKLSAVTRSNLAVNAANAALKTALAGVRVAQANLRSAEASSANAAKDAQRAQTLASEGAISQAVADQRATAAANTAALVDSARQQVSAAEAVADQRRIDVSTAQQQIREAQDAVTQARAQSSAAQKTVQAQQAVVRQTQAGVGAAIQAAQAAEARRTQAAAKLSQANTAPRQVSISAANAQTALAKVKQAEAAVESARIALNRTRILAPFSGIVSHKGIQIGQQVSVGQPLMSIVPDEVPWVIANFKETQVGVIFANQEAEIEVDALPGKIFKGHVDSLSSGTGATFALLPADNATGNFTKVVQRIPVKILLEPNQPNIELLHSGMSVNAVISTKK